MEATQLVLFEVNHQMYGIHIEQVISIEKYIDPTMVPNTPEFIEGMLSLRGQMVLVYNLRTKFKLEKKLTDDNTKMILVQINGLVVAFVVDRVTEITDMKQESFSELPKVIQSEQTSYVESVGKVREQIVIILKLAGFLDSEETNRIQSVLNQ